MKFEHQSPQSTNEWKCEGEVRRGSTEGKCEGEVRRGSAKGKCEGEVRRGSAKKYGRGVRRGCAKGKCEGGKEEDQNQSHHREAELPKGAFEYAAEMHMSGIRFPSSQSTPNQLQDHRGLLHARFDNTKYCKLEVSGISLHCLCLSNNI